MYMSKSTLVCPYKVHTLHNLSDYSLLVHFSTIHMERPKKKHMKVFTYKNKFEEE